MGGNSPSQLSQGDGEGGGVTFVQGIRLSDSVITRMRKSPLKRDRGPASHSCDTPPASPTLCPAVEHLPPPPPPPPPQEAPSTPPSVEPVKLIPPPPVKFHSLPPSVAPPAPVETKPVNASAPPSPPHTPSLVEPASPPPAPFVSPPSELEAPSTPPVVEHVLKAATLPAPVQSAPPGPLASPLSSEHVKPAPPATVEPTACFPSNTSVEALHSPPAVESTAAQPVDPAPVKSLAPQVEPIVLPLKAPAVDSPCKVSPPPEQASQLDAESCVACHRVGMAIIPSDAPVDELLKDPLAPPSPDPHAPAVEPTLTSSFSPVENEAGAAVPPPAAALPVSPEVLEEKLRQKIKEEMQRSLEDEINQRRQQLQRELEEIRAQAQQEAKTAAQALVLEQVKKRLEAEKVAYTENLADSIMRERMKTQDESLLAQLYWMELKAHQLEEREKELRKRDVLYKKHVAKLEAKCTELYKVTAESFQKGKEETLNRFVRLTKQPVCGDLQRQILNCYQENTGKTLSCSRIASAYMQCVDNAKKNKLSTGG